MKNIDNEIITLNTALQKFAIANLVQDFPVLLVYPDILYIIYNIS